MSREIVMIFPISGPSIRNDYYLRCDPLVICQEWSDPFVFSLWESGVHWTKLGNHMAMEGQMMIMAMTMISKIM